MIDTQINENNGNGYHDSEVEEYLGKLRGDTPGITSIEQNRNESIMRFMITAPKGYEEYQILLNSRIENPEEALAFTNALNAFERAHADPKYLWQLLMSLTAARGQQKDMLGTMSTFRQYITSNMQRDKSKSGDSKLGPVNG